MRSINNKAIYYIDRLIMYKVICVYYHRDKHVRKETKYIYKGYFHFLLIFIIFRFELKALNETKCN